MSQGIFPRFKAKDVIIFLNKKYYTDSLHSFKEGSTHAQKQSSTNNYIILFVFIANQEMNLTHLNYKRIKIIVCVLEQQQIS